MVAETASPKPEQATRESQASMTEATALLSLGLLARSAEQTNTGWGVDDDA